MRGEGTVKQNKNLHWCRFGQWGKQTWRRDSCHDEEGTKIGRPARRYLRRALKAEGWCEYADEIKYLITSLNGPPYQTFEYCVGLSETCPGPTECNDQGNWPADENNVSMVIMRKRSLTSYQKVRRSLERQPANDERRQWAELGHP